MSRALQDKLAVREPHAVGHGHGLQALIGFRWVCITSAVCLQMHAPVSKECLESELADNSFAKGKH